MLKVVALQAGAVSVAAATLALFRGGEEARSLLLGGLAYWLPNLVFAWRQSRAARQGRASAVGFMIAEAAKLAAVVCLLYGLTRLAAVSWLAVIAGLFVVMLVNLFVLLLRI
ncbi:MAG: ATP synthase subunit I [Rhodocyclaceae bacterium]|nr:ATP synthase subunit I [Rhodocyclaceae bacterium]